MAQHMRFKGLPKCVGLTADLTHERGLPRVKLLMYAEIINIAVALLTQLACKQFAVAVKCRVGHQKLAIALIS